MNHRSSREEVDARFMQHALALAARGLGRTFPNPAVGAVLVRGGRIVGEGTTAPAGGPHAEIRAVRAAGERARGADLYVTLEPCSHFGRTPPCADALGPLGLRRCVVAMRDPNPRVRGRGVRLLRRSGVEVCEGVGHAEAMALTAGYRSWLVRKRPIVTLKLALSLDGRIATHTGASRWITGTAARRRGHQLRAVHDAILVGAGTVRADDPALTCRLRGGHDPVRVVLAGPTLNVPLGARLFRDGAAPTWVVTTTRAARDRVTALERAGVVVLRVPGRGRMVPFEGALRALGAAGITSVLVEGGGAIAGSALGTRLVDRVVAFVAPMLLGGDGMAGVAGFGVGTLAQAPRLRDVRIERLGRDLMLTGSVGTVDRPLPFASAWPPR